jgi:glucose-6-phosphate isomerase
VSDWAAVEAAHGGTALVDLFRAEPDRLSRLALEQAGIRFDFSKTHLSGQLLGAFVDLAAARNLAAAREALFHGEIVNPTEGRAAEHTAERGQGAPDSVARAAALHLRMRSLIDAIEAGAFGEIAHVVHIGSAARRSDPNS